VTRFSKLLCALRQGKEGALKLSDIHEQAIPYSYFGISNLKIFALLLIWQKRGSPNGSSWMFYWL